MDNRIYGIDLGTTNSIVSYDGEVIGHSFKSQIKNKGKLVENFKTDMSTAQSSADAVISSGILLKNIKAQLAEEGHSIIKGVVSVPAEFSEDQRLATMTAAKEADIEVVALVNEPTAAALRVEGLEGKTAVIFDLGGGTFDVSIVKLVDGFYDVINFKGNPKLGGNDLDIEVFKDLLEKTDVDGTLYRVGTSERVLMNDRIKEIKIAIQSLLRAGGTGKEFVEVNMEDFGSKTPYTLDCIEYEGFVEKVFTKAFVLTEQVIADSYSKGDINDNDDLVAVAVGGSTYCPLIRWKLEEKFDNKVFYPNPDTVVSEGASIFAKLLEEGKIAQKISEKSSCFNVTGVNNSQGKIILKNTELPCRRKALFTLSEDTEEFAVEVTQGDSIARDLNSVVGSLKFNIGEKLKKNTVVGVQLELSLGGLLTVSAWLEERPETFRTINLTRRE